jgi:large subunit ribosomal protein L10
MMLKAEKIAFVKKTQEELKQYKTFGIMPIEAIPDRLVQKIRNEMKPGGKFVIARKNLMLKILEGNSSVKKLEPYVKGNIALIMTNEDPNALYNIISSNVMKLGAKPNQVSPEDIFIESGETSIAPGQAVTDLKSAGIDVKIDKGKVVISKSKVLVAKGAKITTPIAKALKMLDIMPFQVSGKLSAGLQGDLLFREEVLKINEKIVREELAISFSRANALTMEIRFVTPYNAAIFLGRAFNEAMTLGVEAKIYEKGVIEKLLGIASMQASGVDSIVKKE